MKNTAEAGAAEEAYNWTRATYEAAGLGNRFRIECEGTDLDTPEHYLSLIRAAER
jgi:hypothetical protein